MKNSARLLLILISLFLAVSCNTRTVKPKPVVMYEISDEAKAGKEVVLENSYLSLRFLPRTAEIILTDKKTNVQWRSNPPNPDASDTVTKQLMESQFSLEYADNSGVPRTLESGYYSIQRGAYEYEVVDGALEVRYTVGDLARNYRVPPAANEERMSVFLDRMEQEERDIVESTYRLYDINNLRMNDDKDKLLADFPELAKNKLWVLRTASPDFMKEEAEESFKKAGYTAEDFAEDSERYEVSGGDIKPAFSLTLRYILDEKSLIINVPYNKIGYRAAYPLKQLALMPFMGSGSTADSGYMLVPDGSGSLIYFNNRKQNQVPYYINVYGYDDAMPREDVISDNKALFPAFGVHKNGSSLFCVIEEGSAYANIRADVSGRNSAYNIVYPVFDMIHGAIMDIAGRNQRAVYMYEATLPENENITLRYTPCAEPGYVGMAKEYRSWFLEKYPVLQNRHVTGGVPMVVEFIGAVNKIQHRLGLPFDLPLKLTSYKETEKMTKDFADLGWENVYIKLNGWFNRSVEHTVPAKIKLISALGSKGDFEHIVSTAEKNNFAVYPEVDFMFMRDVKTFSGFSLYKDTARYANRERVQRYPYSFVWFGERKLWGKLNYLARPDATQRMINSFQKKAKKYKINNIAFKNMGSRLAGDYHEKRHVSREASMLMRQKKFEEMYQDNKKIMVNAGFAYSIPWTDIITDMIITEHSFGITDSTVPFLQIAIHGIVPYTGKAVNLAEDYTKNLLKTVECGAGLYFSFMEEETSELQETKFRQFYANEYKKWGGDADTLYKKFKKDFGHLYNQKIVNHVILAPDVTITEYEDGTRVLVNASDNNYRYNGNNLSADNYTVLRKGQ